MSGEWGLSAENRVGEMGQWVWLEREGEDPSSGLQNDLRRVRLEKPLGNLRAIVVTQWKKNQESDFAGGIQETLEADKRNSNRRFDKTLHD